MDNFWDFSVWGWFNVLAVLLISLLAAKALKKAGKERSSLWYAPDLRGNPLRFICVAESLRRQIGKFKKYYPKTK